jgi:hypothetical protein
MASNVSDLLLEGNVAARLLQRIFIPDITLAKIRCDSCDCVSGGGIPDPACISDGSGSEVCRLRERSDESG